MSMPPAGFELTLPATKLLQTYALDCAAIGTGDSGVKKLEIDSLREEV
jgi:hypothetical protein